MSNFQTDPLPPDQQERLTPERLEKIFPGLSSDQLLDRVLTHSSLVLWAIDLEGKFLLSRGAGLKELNLRDNEVVGANVFEMYRDYPQILLSLREVLQGARKHEIVEVEGNIFESWYSPIYDEQGQVCGLLGLSAVITELSQYQTALTNAMQQFMLAFQGSPVVMAILRIPDGKIKEVNQTFEKTIGYSRAELIGQTIVSLNLWKCPLLQRKSDFDYSDWMSFHEEIIEARSQAGKPLKWIASGARIRFQEEDCILLFARDADQFLTERALEISQQRYATLARQAPVGIFECNGLGEILSANDFFWSCFSRLPQAQADQDSLSHKPISWFELFRVDDHIPLQQQWTQASDWKMTFKRELQVLSHNFHIEWALLQIDCLPKEENRFLGTMVDISAMKRTEQSSIVHRMELEKAVRQRTVELEQLNQKLRDEVELRKRTADELALSKEQMQAIVKSAVDYIIHLNTHGEIVYINRVDHALLPEQVVGSHFSGWLQGDNLKKGQAALKKIMEEKQVVTVELTLNYPDGRAIPCSLRGAPVLLDGNMYGAVIVARDVTQELELKKQSRERQEEIYHLSRLNIMGEMTTSMSHELKQPLLSIGNYAVGCLKRFEEGSLDLEEATNSLKSIVRLSQKAGGILQRTRDFTAKRPIQLEMVCLTQLLDGALEFIRHELDLKQVELIRDEELDLPAVCLDEIQIQQVLVNLMVNALDAIATCGKKQRHQLQLTTSRYGKNRISLQVRDTADGISPALRENLFEAFHTGKETGLGMGLAISRSIIENHGGTLKVKQTGPEGTTFELLLPINLNS